jgi:hypothetical protein
MQLQPACPAARQAASAPRPPPLPLAAAGRQPEAAGRPPPGHSGPAALAPPPPRGPGMRSSRTRSLPEVLVQLVGIYRPACAGAFCWRYMHAWRWLLRREEGKHPMHQRPSAPCHYWGIVAPLWYCDSSNAVPEWVGGNMIVFMFQPEQCSVGSTMWCTTLIQPPLTPGLWVIIQASYHPAAGRERPAIKQAAALPAYPSCSALPPHTLRCSGQCARSAVVHRPAAAAQLQLLLPQLLHTTNTAGTICCASSAFTIVPCCWLASAQRHAGS